MTDHDLISTLRDPSFVDPFLSPMISFWYHNHYFLVPVVTLVASTRHAPLTSCVYLRLVNRSSAQFANSLDKNDLQVSGTGTAFFESRKSISHTSLHRGVL
jgi:hypothetical protein